MVGPARATEALLLLAVILVAGACNATNPPTRSPGPSGQAVTSPGPSGGTQSATTSPVSPSATPTPSPTLTGFWQLAARALSRSGRLRLVMTGTGKRELRFEPKASGVVADGVLSSVCATGAAYIVQGIQSSVVPGRWACGGSALVSSFRKSGQPVYAWNTRLPADTRIKERVSQPSKDRWQWDYTASSKILGGTVKTTLVLDATTGRLVSGSRTDPTGTTRYTFSYTTIFAPIAVP